MKKSLEKYGEKSVEHNKKSIINSFPLIIFFIALIPRLYFVFIKPERLVFYQYDDAFYYYKIAWNIAHGYGITFTPGIETNGFHPLWLIIILPFFWLFKNSKFIPIQISTFVLALTSSLAYYIGAIFLRDKFKNDKNVIIGYIVLALFSINPVVYYFNIVGMETGFAVLIFAIAFYSHWKLLRNGENYGKYFKLWFIANIILLWLRIDYATIVWLLNLHLLYRWKSKKLFIYIILINLYIFPWILWCKLKFGHWVPISGLAFPFVRKVFLSWTRGPGTFQSLSYAGEVFIKEYLPYYFGFVGNIYGLIVLLLLSALYYINVVKRTKSSILNSVLLPFFLWIIVYSFLQVVIRKNPRDYYAEPITFLIILFIAISGVEFFHWKKKYRYTIIVFFIILFFGGINYYFHDLKWNIYRRGKNIEILKYFQKTNEHSNIGVFNAGKIGYFLYNNVINLDGAVNPEAYNAIVRNKLWDYIKEKQIKYIADMPFYIYNLFHPVMGYDNYIAHLLPIYYYNSTNQILDVGVFEIVDSLNVSKIDSLINSPLVKTRGVIYLARGLQEIGEEKTAMRLILANSSKSADELFSMQGYEWALRKNDKISDAEKFVLDGKIEKAKKIFDEVLNESPKIKDKYSLLTAYYGAKNEIDSALYWSKFGNILTPESPLLAYNQGVLWARKTNFDSSYYYFKKTIKLKPDYANAYTNIGVLFTSKNNCDSALYYTKKAAKLDKLNRMARMNYIAVLQNCEKYNELDKEIDKLLEDIPDIPEKETLLKLKQQIQPKLSKK